MVQVALDPRVPLGRRADVRLPADPGQQRLGGGALACGRGLPVRPQRGREGGRAAGDRREAPLQQIGGPRQQRVGLPLADAPLGQDVFFQRVEPVVEDRTERALVGVRGRKALDEPPVHRLQPVQRGLGLRDLHLGRRESLPLRPLLQPAHEERLAAAVLAADRLALRAAGRHRRQLVRQRGRERIEADREGLQAAPRHGATAERVDDLAAAPGTRRGPGVRIAAGRRRSGHPAIIAPAVPGRAETPGDGLHTWNPAI